MNAVSLDTQDAIVPSGLIKEIGAWVGIGLGMVIFFITFVIASELSRREAVTTVQQAPINVVSPPVIIVDQPGPSFVDEPLPNIEPQKQTWWLKDDTKAVDSQTPTPAATTVATTKK